MQNINNINNVDDIGRNMKKGQQRGQIQYQKWSVIKCKGNLIDVLSKNPPEYKRLANNQIVRIS